MKTFIFLLTLNKVSTWTLSKELKFQEILMQFIPGIALNNVVAVTNSQSIVRLPFLCLPNS